MRLSHVTCQSSSFLLLSSIPLYDCATVYSLTEGCLNLFPVLAVMNNVAINIHVQVSV